MQMGDYLCIQGETAEGNYDVTADEPMKINFQLRLNSKTVAEKYGRESGRWANLYTLYNFVSKFLGSLVSNSFGFIHR